MKKIIIISVTIILTITIIAVTVINKINTEKSVSKTVTTAKEINEAVNEKINENTKEEYTEKYLSDDLKRAEISMNMMNKWYSHLNELYANAPDKTIDTSDNGFYVTAFYKDNWLFLDDNGKVVFRLPHKDFDGVGRFIEGQGFVAKKIKEIDVDYGEGVYMFAYLSVIDSNGHVIKSYDKPAFIMISDGESAGNYMPEFYKGYAKINFITNKDINEISKYSQVLTETVYADMDGDFVNENEIPKYIYEMLNNPEMIRHRFIPDLDLVPKAMFCADNPTKECFAYINKKEEIKIAPKFDFGLIGCGDFYGRNPYFYKDRAMIFNYDEHHNISFSFIDKNGKVVNNEKYNYAEPFYGNITYVELLDDKPVFINTNGEIVWNKKIQDEREKGNE